LLGTNLLVLDVVGLLAARYTCTSCFQSPTV